MRRSVTRIGRALRAHGLSEKGAASVEFVLVFPFFLGVFLSGYEVAIMNMRAVMVERAMDIAVRDIRLSSGGTQDYDEVLADICDQALLIPDCMNVMRLELTAVDTDTWTGMSGSTDCIDREAAIQPPIKFENGQQNELMLIRACAVVDPVFPSIGVGRSIPKDDSGGYRIIASSAFVNEPQ